MQGRVAKRENLHGQSAADDVLSHWEGLEKDSGETCTFSVCYRCGKGVPVLCQGAGVTEVPAEGLSGSSVVVKSHRHPDTESPLSPFSMESTTLATAS